MKNHKSDSYKQGELFQYKEPEIVIGTDEAGRGPLAGPVCAAAVVLPKDFPFEILDDSKKLSPKKRENAEQIIKERAIAYSVCWATPKEIDSLNILNASLLAMKRACLNVYYQLYLKELNTELILIDGNRKFETDIPCKAVVKGDATVHEIMAASILAKNARDRFMLCADKRWPMYGFAKHKGYPTKTHVLAIKEFGFCPIHRKSFRIPSYQR